MKKIKINKTHKKEKNKDNLDSFGEGINCISLPSYINSSIDIETALKNEYGEMLDDYTLGKIKEFIIYVEQKDKKQHQNL